MKRFEDKIRKFKENIETEVAIVVERLQKIVGDAGAKGVVLGMSGGVDCSTVAMLARKADIPVLLVKMPYGKSMDFAGDKADADELISKYAFPNAVVDITAQCDEIIKSISTMEIRVPGENEISNVVLTDLARANVMPRVRMATLYSIAQSMGYLVIGTGNLSEITMGYCTKWGDAACDVNPLARFTKTEVRVMARYLGVLERIITKAPSANLWEGQTDEDEMGMTYEELDTYILTGEGSDFIKNKVEETKKRAI